MKSLPFSKIRTFVLIFALLILSGGIGYRLGERRVRVSITSDKRVIINQNAPDAVAVDFSLFWDVWQRLRRDFIDRTSIDTQKMVWGAIAGMVNSLDDPYTTFLPPKENKEFKEDLGGAFEGIGAQLGMKDGHVIVIAPLKASPADKAGIRSGDWIVKVNSEETINWSVQQAVTKIRGPRGTTVTLNILHDTDQKPMDIMITRQTISVPSVESWIKSANDIKEISGLAQSSKISHALEKIAYLRLSRFGDHTNEDWDKAVIDIVRAKQTNGSIKGLIIDLRNNPGGYLEGSVFIASEFIKSGTVVSQVNSDASKQDFPVTRRGKLLDIPLVVLINKGSASASEIVAGALRDYKRATIVGETSFGKGSVQTPQELRDGSSIHITTGKFLLPKGDWIHKKGVAPDVMVEMKDFDATRDAQLAKAVELLLQ